MMRDEIGGIVPEPPASMKLDVKSSWWPLLIIALAVFVFEWMLMLLFHWVTPNMDTWLEIILDPALLVILMLPGLHVFVVQPLERQIIAHQQTESALQEANARTETRVTERTLEWKRANTHLQAEIAERKRAEQELQRRADELAALYETARALATEQDMPALLRAAVEHATRLLGAPSGNIFLADRAAGDLVLTVAKGTSIQPGLRLRLGEGMAGRVAQTLEPLVVDDYRTWEHRSPQFTPSEPGAIVQVPMLFAGELVGVLTVADLWGAKRTFSEADARLLTLLAGQAASAVHNARLLEETQRLARSDALTGIANRRYLFEAGEREIGRAHRFGHPLCALMFDIDHFKRVNDVYGHKRGDQVLQALAQCCLRQIRDVDILGRYGGEEFVILLVETDIPGARSLAERIRESVAQLLIATDEAAIRITISLGVARLDEGDSDLASLLGRADKALYAAKQAGRNRVEVG
jgi:diguanylate cyclase (GGDEF)-like protein